ncbi:DUF3108 domain-containing protein [uncultured Enterovirga sp.]|uniref:DUF3108 domain-containing protein n=1 Tax=uncultured Enterovirga sp. TaxID=2026352 RepID=UPI0035CC601F
MAARAEEFSATYRVTLAGVPVGEGRVSGRVDEGAYSARVNGKVGILGISNVFDAETQGRFRQTRLQPMNYRVSSSGRESRNVSVAFAGDRAVRTTISPEYSDTERAERTPILPAHQDDVINPLTAVMTRALQAAAGSDPCRGVTPVFSGTTRFDVTFGPGEARDGEIVCQATSRPIAGHKRALETAPPRTVLVAFSASPGGVHLRFPIRIEIPTAFGTFVLRRAS